MSDIGKKTLPPGSWPGARGTAARGTATATDAAASDAGAVTAPRSIAGDANANYHTGHDDQHSEEDDGAASQHYTHQQPGQGQGQGQRQTSLNNIQEEAPSRAEALASGALRDEQADDTLGLIRLDDSEHHDDEGALAHVDPEPMHENSGMDPEGEQHNQNEDDADEGYGSRSSLTERAKQAFDEAAENKPTGEARDQFLKLAGSETGAGGNADTQVQPGASASAAGDAADEAGTKAASGLGSVKEGAASQAPEGQAEGDAQTQASGNKLPSKIGTAASQAKSATEGLAQGVSQAGSKLQSTLSKGQEGQGQTEDVPSQIPEGEVGPDASVSQVGSQIPQDEQGNLLEGAPSVLNKLPPEMREQLAQGIVPSALRSQLGTSAAGHLAEQVHDLQQQQPPPQPQEGHAATEAGEQGLSGSQRDDAAGTQLGAEDAETPVDMSILKNTRVNKGGNVVDSDGRVLGRVTSGVLAHLVGRRVDENGQIWGDDGKVIGQAEPIPENERDELFREAKPFESFPDAVVDAEGMVVSNGEYVGKVVAGDLKVLRGKNVDADGDILDRGGNVIGKAERWEPEPEPEPEVEPEADRSILAGKRVNKAGNVVDGSGVIYGRVVDGDVKQMVGRMCDKYGQILSESGDVIGHAEVVPEGEREGLKEGPFAELSGCTVAKDGKVVTPSGDVVGRLISGDPKVLYGRAVDEDGDVLDRNGNVLGKAERWEEPAVEKKKNPLSGRRVNREGNVVDEDGNLVGKLTTGSLSVCAGKEIDDDGDVVDGKGTVIGHVSLLDEIPPEVEEEESLDEKTKRERAETDKKLAVQMTVCISQCLDKIRPICKMITEKIDHAERQPEDERDEEQLVREVRPLIEEGGRILQEAKGIIKGLDPDGRISANAKHKTAAREATPEEYQLADVLKDLTGEVTECIENAKRKIEDMPHAKKELNPLWGLLNEPLFQILAAVGLLLNGVLSLVGRLLSGLGLGGLLDGLLGTLGLNRVLEGLGLGAATKALTGGDKKKKSGGGGLLGGLLGGGS